MHLWSNHFLLPCFLSFHRGHPHFVFPLKKESDLLPCCCLNSVALFKGNVQLPPVAGMIFVLSKKKKRIMALCMQRTVKNRNWACELSFRGQLDRGDQDTMSHRWGWHLTLCWLQHLLDYTVQSLASFVSPSMPECCWFLYYRAFCGMSSLPNWLAFNEDMPVD